MTEASPYEIAIHREASRELALKLHEVLEREIARDADGLIATIGALSLLFAGIASTMPVEKQAAMIRLSLRLIVTELAAFNRAEGRTNGT